MIHPTIGRVVLFRANKTQSVPFPALVCKVHSDRMINVGGFNESGGSLAATSVPLLQDDDLPPETGYYAEWMPYQKQAEAERVAKITPQE